MEYFTGALKQYADFKGRARRKEYWMFILFYILIYLGMAVIDRVTGMMLFTSVYSLVMFIPTLSIAARRLHDTSRTGWWQLIALIPLIGFIVLIIFLVQDSHPDNDYGPNPKAVA